MSPIRLVSKGCLLLVLVGLAGCGDPADVALTCDALLLPEEARFPAVFELVERTCSACHSTRTPVYGYDFEDRSAAYDALRTKMDRIYRQVASGEMPQIGGRWTSDQLATIRTWYCDGAFYDE